LLTVSQIGSDCGLLAKPVTTDTLTMSIAERWEAIIDFAPYKGQNITLMNQRGVGADQDFDNTDKVLRFVVGNTVSDNTNNGAIPATLRNIDFPDQAQSVSQRHFMFHHSGEWLINNIGWNDGLPARLLAQPQRGATEIWELQNGGGGWSHPIHIHLVDFQVISRVNGKRAVLPYEAAAQQDVSNPTVPEKDSSSMRIVTPC
jgi:bilirubin oxidase